MYIGKTVFDKNVLIALQKELIGSTRTHENELVAISYALKAGGNAVDLLRNRDAMLESLITYVFAWGVRRDEVSAYRWPHMYIQVRDCRLKDGEPAYLMIMQASLNTWLRYVVVDTNETVKRFVDVVTTQLQKDGYNLLMQVAALK